MGAFWATLQFYAEAAVITTAASIKARRGELTNADLVRGSHALRRALERAGVSISVSGIEVLSEQNGPFVFVANHMSALETQVLPAILEAAAPCTFVVKDGLTSYPIFGPVLHAFDPIVIKRTEPKADLAMVLQEGSARLRKGISVIVFPQAHRTQTFDPQAFNSIGMRLARFAGVPMVPIALSTTAWTIGRIVKDIGWIVPSRPVRFAIGSPVIIGSDGGAAHRRAAEFIGSTIAEWNRVQPCDARR